MNQVGIYRKWNPLLLIIVFIQKLRDSLKINCSLESLDNSGQNIAIMHLMSLTLTLTL